MLIVGFVMFLIQFNGLLANSGIQRALQGGALPRRRLPQQQAALQRKIVMFQHWCAFRDISPWNAAPVRVFVFLLWRSATRGRIQDGASAKSLSSFQRADAGRVLRRRAQKARWGGGQRAGWAGFIKPNSRRAALRIDAMSCRAIITNP